MSPSRMRASARARSPARRETSAAALASPSRVVASATARRRSRTSTSRSSRAPTVPVAAPASSATASRRPEAVIRERTRPAWPSTERSSLAPRSPCVSCSVRPPETAASVEPAESDTSGCATATALASITGASFRKRAEKKIGVRLRSRTRTAPPGLPGMKVARPSAPVSTAPSTISAPPGSCPFRSIARRAAAASSPAWAAADRAARSTAPRRVWRSRTKAP